MTQSSSTRRQQNKPPDPITTTSKSSLNSSSSSTLSISPSPSVLLPSRRRSSRTPIPQPTTSSTSTSSIIGATTARNTKLEQIIQNFYAKTAQIIIQSRVPNDKLNVGVSGSSATHPTTSRRSSQHKINKWFNITTNDCENLKQDLKFWKSLVKYNEQEEEMPPLIIDIYLETTEPELLQEGDDHTTGWHKLNLNHTQHILIESWTLRLCHPFPDFPVDLPNLYKRSIVFFRSLHSLVRLLPSHNLYRRLRVHDGELSLGYKISSAHIVSDEIIPLEYPISNVDTTQVYDFKDVVTPLGTFKLKLLYRDHVQFDTREENQASSTLQHSAIDTIEENFFTPTMTKYRQEQQQQQQSPMITPSVSSSSAKSAHRIQSLTARTASNNIPMTNRYLNTSTSSTTEKRISAPFVSPFKSPSLSSSPQTELMFTSRSQTPEKPRPESIGSFGKKIEFSSSFDKFRSSTHSSTSSHKSAHSVAAAATNPAPDMMRRWSRTSDNSSINLVSRESEEDEEGLEEFMMLIGARQELKLFQQQASMFAEKSVVAPQQQLIDNEQQESKKSLSHFRNIQEAHNVLSDSMMSMSLMAEQKQAANSYESSTSSSLNNKGLNQPAIPSPLHRTNDSELFSAKASGKKPATDHYAHLTEQQHDIVTQSPLKNRQAPPLPPPPSAPTRRISSSAGLNDDDDSLMFKMSELSGNGEEEVDEDYLQQQRIKRLDPTGMRRIHSSGNIPSTKPWMKDNNDSGSFSDDNTSANRHKLTHSLFFNNE